MKKFTKISLVIMGILFIAGLGFSIAAIVLAGGVRTLASELQNGRWNVHGWQFEDGIYHNGDVEINLKEIVNGTLGLLPAGSEKLTEVFEEEITRLEIEADLASIEIKTGNVQELKVDLKNGYLNHYESEADGDTLYVYYNTKGANFTEGPEITIEVPQYRKLEYVSIHTSLGEIEVDELQSDSVYLYSDLGNVEYSGTARVLEVQADMGNIEAELTGEEKHYNIELSADLGTVTYNGKKVNEEINNEFTSQHHHSSGTVSLHSSMGNVKLRFRQK